MEKSHFYVTHTYTHLSSNKDVVIGFGYCNHWNLIFCRAKRRFAYIWFGLDWRERVFINKV